MGGGGLRNVEASGYCRVSVGAANAAHVARSVTRCGHWCACRANFEVPCTISAHSHVSDS